MTSIFRRDCLRSGLMSASGNHFVVILTLAHLFNKPCQTDNMLESQLGTEPQKSVPDPEISPNPESIGTESDQEELESHDATMYVSFYFSGRIYTGRASETIAQIEHFTLHILGQIMAPLAKSRRSIIGTHPHRQGDGKVEIQIADRRKDKTGG